MSENLRIRTTPGGGDKHISVQINQKFDLIEILSLKISQEDAYRRFCSDYGAVVGRVIVNNGVGVPNAKVSIFIPIDDDDKLDPEVLGLYPYEVITDRDADGVPYNLLPNNARGKDDCFTTVGTFPSKREIQDNPELAQIYCKYYKFTTTTNDSGDFMFFGVPVGNHFLHVDADLSDIGILSQRPYDLIREGASERTFSSPTKYRSRKESSNPNQLRTISPISVNVIPFWGDTEECEIGITRADVDLQTNITPTAIFMGSIISDSEKNSVNKTCRPRKKLGKLEEMVTGEGTIEMIRKTIDGGVERFDVEGGTVIDENGAWAYQVPMNLDYMVTSEDGQLVPSDDPTKGIPTKARVRFRIGMDVTGDEGRLRTRAKYLVPNNPNTQNEADYSFDSTTKASSFAELSWNKIYSVKNHITRIQKGSFLAGGNAKVSSRNFIGIKNVDDGRNTPFPFNRMDTDINPIFLVICLVVKIIATLVTIINFLIIPFINFVLFILNQVLRLICEIIYLIGKTLSWFAGLISKIPFVSISVDKCDFCIGSGCCDCKDILPYIPYITLPCPASSENYAPGGVKSPFPWDITYNATTQPFHYPNDGHGGHGYFANIIPPIPPFPGDAGWSDCIAISLADALDVFEMDFYNDWINGTLYAFLVKYKKKTKANGDIKEKFCEIDCNGSGSQGTGDNKCRGTFVLDTCHNNTGVNSGVSKKINRGVIKKYDDELYYASYNVNGVGFKLYATDIISLGSIFDCDWEGIPKLYPFLIETTYNFPPLVPDYDDTLTTILVSGFANDNTFGAGAPLIAKINCILGLYETQCENIKRLSEIGMGLDEDRTDDGGIVVDNKINNFDVENAFTRGVFAYVNDTTIATNSANIPLIFIDNDLAYNVFRGSSIVQGSGIIQHKNSFYFYFGLHPGKTALNKLLKRYFTECIPETDKDFYVALEELTDDDGSCNGAINITVFGGTPPYTYSWTGPNGFTSGLEDPSGLCSGTYNVSVTDSTGLITDGVFIVGGPAAMFCDIQSTDLTQFAASDGTITVNITNGNGPFTTTVYEYIQTSSGFVIGPVATTTTPNPQNGTSPQFNGLAAGIYWVEVLDSSTPNQQTCGDSVNIYEPNQLFVTITGTPETCYGLANGSVSISISGGTPPYTINNWQPVSPPFPNSGNLGGLGNGTYSVDVTDNANQTITVSHTLQGPDPITQTSSVRHFGCFDITHNKSENGCPLPNAQYVTDNDIANFPCGTWASFTINTIAGGTPPYEINFSKDSSSVYDQTLTNIASSNLPLVFNNNNTGLDSGGYRIEITDSNGCVLTPNDEYSFTILKPNQPLVINTFNIVYGTTTLPPRITITHSGGWDGMSQGTTQYEWYYSDDDPNNPSTWQPVPQSFTTDNNISSATLRLADSNFECYDGDNDGCPDVWPTQDVYVDIESNPLNPPNYQLDEVYCINPNNPTILTPPTGGVKFDRNGTPISGNTGINYTYNTPSGDYYRRRFRCKIKDVRTSGEYCEMWSTDIQLTANRNGSNTCSVNNPIVNNYINRGNV